MPKKTKKKNLILENQKLKRRKKNHFILVSKRFVAPGLIFFLGISTIIGLGYGLSKLEYFPSTEDVRIKLSKSIPEPEYSIIRTYLDHKPFTSIENLIQIPKEVQEITSAKSIHILALNHNNAFLTIEKHVPEAGISYGKMRLLSNEGKVFGSYKQRQHSHLPIIKGLTFSEKIQMRNDQSIKLSKANSSLVQEALLLIRNGLRYNIKYKTILFNPDRGFRVWLRSKRIRVEMGRAPFNKRHMKLEKILSNLEKKRVAKARIELDYQGKAFIKEYSL